MNFPNQSSPILRNKDHINLASHISPSGLFCGICKDAIGGVGKLLIGEGCTAAVVGFEAACNAALDLIPIIGEGPSEIACAAGGVALEVACKAGGGVVTKGVIQKAQNTVCGHFC